MAKKDFPLNIDLMQNELLNSIFHKLSTPPLNPKIGQYYFDNEDNKPYYWTGLLWKTFGDEQIPQIQSDLAQTDTNAIDFVKNKSTDNISEGSTNLYFTDQRAIDAVSDLIPTNTSDLNNDSGFITIDDVPTIDVLNTPLTDLTESTTLSNITATDTILQWAGKFMKLFTSLKALAFKTKADWSSDIENIPSYFPPETHEHVATDLSGGNNKVFGTDENGDGKEYALTDFETQNATTSDTSGTITLAKQTVTTLTTTLTNAHTLTIIPELPTVFTNRNYNEVVLTVGATPPSITWAAPTDVVFTWTAPLGTPEGGLKINTKHRLFYDWESETSCIISRREL